MLDFALKTTVPKRGPLPMNNTPISTTLRRLAADDATIGAVLYIFPSGRSKSASWQSKSVVADTLALAKSCAAEVRNQLMNEGAADDLDRTNWPSLVAGTQKHISDWNTLLTRSLTSATRDFT